ncbi:MAG: hypothetical protein GX442_20575 [Candidatus Riflebacteria bacterium]|nr:hypothetical protein [Candidatus Riflebacteria bacterium]
MEALHLESTAQTSLDLPPDPPRTWPYLLAGLGFLLAGAAGSFIKAHVAGRLAGGGAPLTPTLLHLSLSAFGLVLLSQCLASQGQRRGALAGGLLALLLMYPAHRAFMIAAQSPGLDLPALDRPAMLCLAGALLVLAGWFLGRPASPLDGFQGGFLCGGIPTAILGFPLLDVLLAAPLFAGLLGIPVPQLMDCMGRVILVTGRLLLGSLVLILLPLLTGLIGCLRRADPAARPPAGERRLTTGPATFLTGLLTMAALTEIVTVAALLPSIYSMRQMTRHVAVLPEFPYGAFPWLGLLPCLVPLFLGWSLFFAYRGHLDRGSRILAFLVSTIFLMTAAAGLLICPSDLRWLFLLHGVLGLLLWLFLGPPLPPPEAAPLTARPPWENGFAGRTLLGGVTFTLLVGPLTNLALAVGLLFIPLIAYCSAGVGGQSIEALRAMARFTDLWPTLAALVTALFLAGAALAAKIHFFQAWMARPALPSDPRRP